jgi:hypothetical protein
MTHLGGLCRPFKELKTRTPWAFLPMIDEVSHAGVGISADHGLLQIPKILVKKDSNN